MNVAKIAATTGTVVVAAAGGVAVFALAEPPSGTGGQAPATRTVASALDQPPVAPPAPQPAAAATPTPMAVHEYAKAAVATVSDGARSTAGFVVSPDGLIVTCTGALGTDRRVTVQIGGDPATRREAVVLGGDASQGLAVLRFDAGAAGAAALSFSERPAAAGDHVYAIAGSQPATGTTVTSVDRETQAADGSMTAGAIRTGAHAAPGAPVLDVRGAVVGVGSEAGGDNRVVPATAVQALLAQVTAGAAAAQRD